jgi:hypothetical protein
MKPRFLAYVAVWACVFTCVSSGQAQESSENAETAKATVVAANALEKNTAIAQETSSVAKAAGEAGTKAIALIGKVEALSAALKAGSGDGYKTAAGDVIEPAKAAVDAAKVAADAALALAGKIPAGGGKTRAAEAAVEAVQRSAEAAKAQEDLAKQKKALDTATADTAARKAADAMGIQASAIAKAAADVAQNAQEVGTQATAPDLPVLTESDSVTLAALRARITGGAILSNGDPAIVKTGDGDEQTATVTSDQFSQAAMYLAFETQPSLLAFKDSESLRASRVYLEPFLDLRLTTIPVAGAPAIQRIEAPDAAFVQSQKAVQVQGGLLLSYNFGAFEMGGARFHWGIAPVFRAGFQSVTDSYRAVRVWNFDDDLFDNETGGVRLILYKGPSKAGFVPAREWMPTAYLEFSLGQFQNFETATAKAGPDQEVVADCLAQPARCLANGLPSGDPKTLYDLHSQKNRIYIEGRLALNYLYLGFDINNGDGGDDLRVIGGLTFDIQQLFRRK